MAPYAVITATDFTYTGQRDLPDTGLMDYRARFYSPYITQFSQPDSIVPNLYNPQSLNRYSYVLNNPIRYTDPTGHYCVDEDADGNIVRVDCETSEIKLKKKNPPAHQPSDKDDKDSHDDGFPLPENLKLQLEAHGADAELLDNVIINTNPSNIMWQLSCGGSWNKNVIARTSSNNINWCKFEYFDFDTPSPVLVHELVHVAQYAKYPNDVIKEQKRTFMFDIRDMIAGAIDENWQKYNPYESSWVEVQAANCQNAYQKDNNIPLDRPPCNIWITLP